MISGFSIQLCNNFGIVVLAFIAMFSTMLPDLGSVRMGENSNSKISGNCNNEGSIVHNSNMDIICSDSKVNLEGNSNSKVKLINTEGAIRDSSNGVVDWKDSPVNIQSNSNYQIYGGGGASGRCNFLDNSNFKFSGFSSLNCVFERNSNTDVNMKEGGDVKATGNSNLMIDGRKQNLFVSGVSNHQITCNDKNRFQIINPDQGGWFSSFFGRSSDPFRPERIRYELDYVGKAAVNRGSYEVGDFKWDMVRDGNEINLHFNNQQGNRAGLVFEQINPNTLKVSLRDSGVEGSHHQVLSVSGPLPLLVNEGSRTVKVPLVSTANL